MTHHLNPTSTRVLMLGAGLDVKGGITSVEKLILENQPADVQIRHVATFAQGSALHNVKVFLNAGGTLFWSLLWGKADLVHLHFAERGSALRQLILSLIALAFRKPMILHAHGATFREFYAGIPPLGRWALKTAFGQCTKFIALSESWQVSYSEMFQLQPSQVEVLHNPVYLPPTPPTRTGRTPVTFVFLGRIGKRGGALDRMNSLVKFPKQDKGAFDLIQAFAALPVGDRQQARLILAGNGDVDAARQLIQDLQLEHQITVHAWIDAAQRDALLAEADAFVLPSFHEGLPMSMLEAMAWNLPVIVTPVGGIPEVIVPGKNGLFVTPGNQPEITQALQTLIQNEPLRLQMGNAARSSVQFLDVKHYIRTLTDLYRSVVRRKSTLGDRPPLAKTSS